jgi:NADPH:quinone reductase-like Zn-dependent oxidoreductase
MYQVITPTPLTRYSASRTRQATMGGMSTSERVLVYGAAGHTGRFVVDELRRRGLTSVLAGRSAARLADAALAANHVGVTLDTPRMPSSASPTTYGPPT